MQLKRTTQQFSHLPGKSGYGHCSAVHLVDFQKKIDLTTDAHIHPQRGILYNQTRHMVAAIHPFFAVMHTFLSLCRSAHRQAAAHHPPRPVQSDARGGQRGTAEVPGLRRPHPLHQLAEGWGQSAGKGPPHVPAGAGQPADQKHQGTGGFTRVKDD